jgi:hypothetical protein
MGHGFVLSSARREAPTDHTHRHFSRTRYAARLTDARRLCNRAWFFRHQLQARAVVRCTRLVGRCLPRWPAIFRIARKRDGPLDCFPNLARNPHYFLIRSETRIAAAEPPGHLCLIFCPKLAKETGSPCEAVTMFACARAIIETASALAGRVQCPRESLTFMTLRPFRC